MTSKVQDVNAAEAIKRQATTHSIDEAKESLESGFGGWEDSGKLLYISHLFWLLKEAFWLLLISPASIACGAVSVFLGLLVAWKRRDGGASGKLYNESGSEVLVGMTQLGWLIFNFIMMVVGFVYERPQQVPGYAGGILDMMNKDCVKLDECDDDATYEFLVIIVRVGFILTFCLWLSSCSYLLIQFIKPPRFHAQGYAFQTCLLEGGWIAFWVLKDFAWTFDKDGMPYAIAAWVIHFIILGVTLLVSSAGTVLWDGVDAKEMQQLIDVVFCGKHLDFVMISYVFWSISSLVWLLMETAMDEDPTMRYVAAIICWVSVLLFLKGYSQAKQKAEMVSTMQHKFQELQQKGDIVPSEGPELS